MNTKIADALERQGKNDAVPVANKGAVATARYAAATNVRTITGTGQLASASSVADIDALVAHYAPIGKRHRKLRRTRLVGAIAAVLTFLLGVIALWQWLPVAGSLTINGGSSAGASSGAVSVPADAGNAERRDLDREKSALAQRNTQLAQDMAALDDQRRGLQQQQREVEEQRAQLAQTMSQFDAQRRALEQQRAQMDRAGRSQAAKADESKSGQQRRDLAQQRQFVAQGAALERQIKELNAQRIDLERQREQLDKQRNDLQALFDRIDKLGGNNPQTSVIGPAGVEPSAPMTNAPAVASVAQAGSARDPMAARPGVGDEVLEEMRGGIRTADGYDISIGLTRSTSINGVEQFSHSFNLDLTRGGGVPDMQQNALTLIQNGPGNMVSPAVLAALSGNAATIIQNTLDNQAIGNKTVLDISLQNVSSVVHAISASQAVSESLRMQH